jgi:hypothetical protein
MEDFLAQEAWFTDHKRPAVILVAVLGIPVLADDRYSCKRLWEPLLAREQGHGRLTDYIQGVRIVFQAAQPVGHLTSDYSY